jgi:gluconolactonase
MEVLAEGFVLAEAPLAGPDGSIYFSDAVGGGVRRIDADGRVEVVLERRRGVGGMAWHRDGGLVVTGRTVQVEGRDLLPAQPGVTGFNDMGVADDGTFWAGALTFNPFEGEDPAPGAVFKGALRVETPGIRWPNGIGFSPDGRVAYVCDFADGVVHAGPADGDSLEPWVRSPRGSFDGLAVDADGGVWVALGAGCGVARFSGDGALDSILDVDSDFVTSMCFAGDGDLVITTNAAVLREHVGVRGRPIPVVQTLRERVEAALVDLAPSQRAELEAELEAAESFDDLRGKWQAAVLEAEGRLSEAP